MFLSLQVYLDPRINLDTLNNKLRGHCCILDTNVKLIWFSFEFVLLEIKKTTTKL